jgi:hypothetical protein
MTVLCIDIGLKNLSLCIMSKDTEGKYTILLWDNHNLLHSDPKKCTGVLSNKTGLCTKNASMIDANGHTYCKIHSRGKTVKPIPKEKLVTSYLLQDIVRIVIDKVNSLYSEHKALFDTLSKVFIEKQPRINNKMQLVSNVIFTKFVELLPLSTIRFISASKKLKIIGSSKASTTGTLKGAKGYDNRKKLSIALTREFFAKSIIADSAVWEAHFNSKNKLDDMADSFCFCVSALE